jgi:hypothetical protein
MLDQVIRLAPLLGPLIAAAIAVLGWYMAHRFNTARDRINKRHDMITQYLLEAYRRLEMAANREDKTEEQAIAFESALADIQLLGSPAQISATVEYLEAHASAGGGTIDQVLCLLRDDLRKELGLSLAEKPPKFFRFVRDWNNGDWKGYPVCRTTPVRAEEDRQH